MFWNREPHTHIHAHEGTWTMKAPLVILSIATVFTGFVPFSRYVTSDGIPLESHINLIFSIAPVSLAIIGIAIASFLYKRKNDRPGKLAASMGGLYKAAYRKFYIDEVYLFVTKKIIFNLIGRPAAWIDKNIVDGFMNLMADATGKFAEMIKGVQSGKIQNYTMYFFAGVAALAGIFIYWMER